MAVASEPQKNDETDRRPTVTIVIVVGKTEFIKLYKFWRNQSEHKRIEQVYVIAYSAVLWKISERITCMG